MNLEKLFQTQKVLRDRINYQGEDRFNKLILALLVELGELANEKRSWKYWSKDQTPRTRKARVPYMDLDDAEFYNPLLEEYVDCLHFVLEIGLEHEFDKAVSGLAIEEIKFRTIEEQFIALFKTDWEYCEIGDASYYHEGLEIFISLGEMLGFTWEQIEQAYYDKNKINHIRQESGY